MVQDKKSEYENLVLDIENLRILSKPQYIIALISGVISVTVIIVTQIVTFQNMKDEVAENKEIIKTIRTEMSEQKLEFLKEFQKLQSQNAKIQGKVELLTEGKVEATAAAAP